MVLLGKLPPVNRSSTMLPTVLSLLCSGKFSWERMMWNTRVEILARDTRSVHSSEPGFHAMVEVGA